MKNPHYLVDEILQIAGQLPHSVVASLAKGIELEKTNSPNTARILSTITHAGYRKLASDLLKHWQEQSGNVTADALALALRTAAECEMRHRQRQNVELVWTGPDSEEHAFRRTEQAILQVLDMAQERIILVSYAVYNIPNICEALIRAAKRRVRICLIVETPDRIEGQNEYSTLRALGKDVADCSQVYYWPEDQRQKEDGGKCGLLHVKCALADGKWLFISSANLTEYAFTINMELGFLVTGGPLPIQVQKHFDRLIAARILLPVS